MPTNTNWAGRATVDAATLGLPEVFGMWGGGGGGNGIDDHNFLDVGAERASWHPGRESADTLNSLFDKYASAINRFEAMGRPVPQWYRTRLEQISRAGGTGTGQDFTSEDFNMNSATHLRGLERRRTGTQPSPAVWNAENQTLLAEAQKRADQKFFDEQVNPGLQTAQGIAQNLATTPTFDAQKISDMRSQMAAGIKSSEENRLKSIASIFGVSGGLASGSPAATALAQRTALEADNKLANSLTQMGIDVSQTNRNNASSAAQMLSNLSIARQQARQAATAGDRQRLYQISDNLAATMEALNASRQLREDQQKAAGEAQDATKTAGLYQLGGSLLGSAMTAFAPKIGAAKAATSAIPTSPQKSPDEGAWYEKAGDGFDYNSIY